MRKLLELLAIGDGHYRQHYNAVKSFLKVQANDGDKSRTERLKRALNPHEATALLGVWRNDTSDVGIRNDVMIRLLVYTGLRRSELVALHWTDINAEDLTITVRHGKGDKERVVAHCRSERGNCRGIAVSAECAGRRLHTCLSLNDAWAYGHMGGRHSDGGSDGDASCLPDCKTGGPGGPGAT